MIMRCLLLALLVLFYSGINNAGDCSTDRDSAKEEFVDVSSSNRKINHPANYDKVKKDCVKSMFIPANGKPEIRDVYVGSDANSIDINFLSKSTAGRISFFLVNNKDEVISISKDDYSVFCEGLDSTNKCNSVNIISS